MTMEELSRHVEEVTREVQGRGIGQLDGAVQGF
jgi:hypothetical protein